ncbi:hypothetical protein BZG36_05462 [Bifiguratus adelaidae]|uniref:Late embryogenesis abundant protein LEA-2 subgroup domain-containing protein n=1 Tax=Bifiguratus adelaidae TaxID=1938954 RepID=A0A261XT31_9FUNG|nr:hypothetical protein BZG36_05462 [Bifiguratus adelaidae]
MTSYRSTFAHPHSSPPMDPPPPVPPHQYIDSQNSHGTPSPSFDARDRDLGAVYGTPPSDVALTEHQGYVGGYLPANPGHNGYTQQYNYSDDEDENQHALSPYQDEKDIPRPIIAGTFKAPTTKFEGVTNNPNASLPEFQVTGLNSFNVNLGLQVFVQNPNIIGATFDTVTAKAYYPISGQQKPIGGGTLDNVNIGAHSSQNITFPFTLNVNGTQDSDVLNDLATKCGLFGGAQQQLTVDYTITLGLKILFIPINPSFSSSASFACPITSADFSKIQLPSAVQSAVNSLQTGGGLGG